jgi:hypothetical protein
LADFPPIWFLKSIFFNFFYPNFWAYIFIFQVQFSLFIRLFYFFFLGFFNFDFFGLILIKFWFASLFGLLTIRSICRFDFGAFSSVILLTNPPICRLVFFAFRVAFSNLFLPIIGKISG